ncbi:efflux transporter outer membrane subunit [Roseomonas sp. BN140053]|uniref:efflux transporter outer membrane subunit n=1 Tax=Roseomonas sp. BN140053 TaxID=3391898 RepID=UPI0039EBC26A
MTTLSLPAAASRRGAPATLRRGAPATLRLGALATPRRGVLATLLGGLVGCGPQAEPVVSGIALPSRFREAGDAPVQWPDPQWWAGFGSPELNRLMAEAAAGNFDLAAAAARIRQADAQLRIAGSALFPQLDGGANVTRSRPAGSNGNRFRGTTTYDLSLSASYELDLWGRIRSTTDAAAFTARASRFDAAAVGLTTEASVANTYFQVLEAAAELRVEEENLDAAQRTLAVIRAQVTAGTATGLDLAQQETVVAQQQANIPPLRQSIAQNTLALATLVGRPPEDVTVSPAGFDQLRVPAVSPGLPAELLARRPDVLAAEANLAAANADVAAARAALLPTAVLSAQGGFRSLVLGTLISPEATFYSLVAQLAQTIFDGGARRGQVELSRAQAEELLVEYRRAIVSALVDVDTSLVALRETTEQEKLRAEAAARAARAFGIAEAQLRAGTINLITLLTAQGTLFSARTALVQVRLARLQAAVGLFRSLGGGWR